MKDLDFTALEVGDALQGFETEPISRLMLALYCGASGDHNPIHVDSDYARATGHTDVFAHGMLSMAYLGRLLTNWVPQEALREFGVRFVAMTHVGDSVRCRGKVVGKELVQGEQRLRLLVEVVDRDGHQRLIGEASVALR